MADIDGAIGYVVAHGDPVDRARLSYLRSGAAPPPDAVAKAEMGQAPGGGWPAFWAGDTASVDATCFRLAELDDLGALDREPARKALAWLAKKSSPAFTERSILATLNPGTVLGVVVASAGSGALAGVVSLAPWARNAVAAHNRKIRRTRMPITSSV